MTTTTSDERPPAGPVPLEPERYELHTRPAYRFEVDRREFVKLLGGGLVVLAAGPARAQESGVRGGGATSPPPEINA